MSTIIKHIASFKPQVNHGIKTITPVSGIRRSFDNAVAFGPADHHHPFSSTVIPTSIGPTHDMEHCHPVTCQIHRCHARPRLARRN
jgi:hypothetical protein